MKIAFTLRDTLYTKKSFLKQAHSTVTILLVWDMNSISLWEGGVIYYFVLYSFTY